jgi:hypothetical protein
MIDREQPIRVGALLDLGPARKMLVPATAQPIGRGVVESSWLT